MKTPKKNVIIVSAFLISILIAYLFGVYATTPSTTPTFSTGPYPGAPTYTIYTNGSWYYAKNEYGGIEYSSTSAAVVIQNVFDTHPSFVFFKNGTTAILAYHSYTFNFNVTTKQNLINQTSITLKGLHKQ